MKNCCLIPALLLLNLTPTATLAEQAPAPTGVPTVPPGANLRDPQTLMALAGNANGLDAASLKPWHLTATYETFDDSGKQMGSGVFEEWWIAHDKWKRSYTSARFTQTEYQTPEGHSFETEAGAAPWPESLIEQQMVRVTPGKEETDESRPEIHDENFGNVKLACVMLRPTARKSPGLSGCFPPTASTSRAPCFDSAYLTAA